MPLEDVTYPGQQEGRFGDAVNALIEIGKTLAALKRLDEALTLLKSAQTLATNSIRHKMG